MTFAKYCKDRWWMFLTFAVSMGLIWIFLSAYHNSSQEKIVVFLICFLTFLIFCFTDFFRKRAFFNEMLQKTKELDKKYLITDVMEDCGFYEGAILQDILRDCNKSMAEEVAEYRQNSKEFREYIETWVHEVKIPVSSLRLMCHNNSEMEEKMVSPLKQIDDDINNVLFYARSECSHKDYIIKEVNVKKVFTAVAVANRIPLQLLDAQIHTEGLDICVTTDEKWLEFILGQLMSNSMKYRDPIRRLELEIFAKENEKVVEVHFKDNGIGIPAADLNRVFEKSFTGENGRSGAASTGMGLHIVKNLCDKLGHKISVQSQKGEYTEMILVFSKNRFYKM